MKLNYHKPIAAVLFLLGVLSVLTAQEYTTVIDKAREAYKTESFDKAYSILSLEIPDTTADSNAKRAASDLLSSIGVEEYSIRNYKNAYEAFRRALKYDPTNAQATSYFLKIRKEMNVMALQNEAPPRSKPAPEEKVSPVAKAESPASSAPIPAPAAAQPAPAAASSEQAPPPGTPTPQTAAEESRPAIAAAPVPFVPPPVLPDPRIEELKLSLAVAESRLMNMESSVSSKGNENQALRNQVEQQMTLLQKFIDRQAEMAAAAAARPETPPPPAESEQEKMLIAKTMEILTKVSEREVPPPQIVVQSDPAVKELVEKFGSVQEDLKRSNSRSVMAMIATATVSALLLGMVLFFMYLALRRRRRIIRTNEAGLDSRISGNTGLLSLGPAENYHGETPLLEFVGSEGTEPDGNRDFGIRRDLLKADRLSRLHAEIKSGTLGWNTVRQYIGELELSIKAEILKTVERKLDEGDLVSKEAILPVIFPFLTDFDDYLRQKSENLARRALTGPASHGKSPLPAITDGSGTSGEGDPLSLERLLEIPKKLQVVYKDHDLTLGTAKICRSMSAVLGLTAEDRNLLYLTALAHDCGYLIIDHDRLARIIAKKEIDEEEFAFLKTHVAAGIEYFQGIELPEQFRGGIMYHHERNDGSGYPEGLKKEEIPVFAKIIGIAETFATLTTNRPYRNKWGVEQALSIISDGARSKFDAEHVAALVKVAASMGEGR